MEKEKSKKLYINALKEAHLNFNLCVFVRPELYSWFYEHFINIAIINNIVHYAIEFLDNSAENSCRELMGDRMGYTYEDFPQDDDIIKHLIRSIDKDFYTAMWVDKYYIPDNESHMNWHFVHGVMVYGYDDVKKTISFVNFSFEKGIILQEISYNNFIQAFVNGKKYYKQGGGTVALKETVTSFTVKTNYGNNVFELDRFMSELHDYLHSTVNIAKLREVDLSSSDVVYGISVYDKLIDVLEQFEHRIIDDVIAFKSFGDMWLHKEYIYDRLTYIKNNYEITTECQKKIDDFKKVSDLWRKAKFLNMKFNMVEGKMAAMLSRNPKFISKFTEIIKEARRLEMELLHGIYGLLNRYALPKEKLQNIISKDDYYIEYFEDNNRMRIVLREPKLIEYIEIMDNNQILYDSGTKRVCFNDGEESVVQIRQYNILHKNHFKFNPKKVEWLEYLESYCDCVRRDVRNLDFYIYKPMGKLYWNFAASQYVCCDRKANAAFAGFGLNSLQNGNNFKLFGNDPNMIHNVSFDADKSKYVYFKYDTVCQSENAQLFFATYDHPVLSEDKSKVFTISPGDRAFEYIVDMSDNGKWGGVAKQLRFDPVSYDNTSNEGECTIEYIEISDRLPIYGSEKDYMKTQGVNGWSYHTYNNGITYREMAWDGENGRWAAVNDNETTISQTAQSSKNHMGTVRRWTCPADGSYHVKYSFGQTADNRPDRDRLSSVTLRRNHRVIEKDTYDSYTGTLAGSREAELMLERGEVLNFEFYNGSEHTTETLEISVVIEKQKP